MNKLLCGFIWTFWIFVAVADEIRTVHPPDVNPGCPVDKLPCDRPWLVHVVAEGKNDSIPTLHHIWGAVGAPTAMVAVTDHSNKLMVDWEALVNGTSGSITFDNPDEVHYAFGFVIPNMILFDDVNDTGTIDDVPEEKRVYIPVSDFTWILNQTLTSEDKDQGVLFETVEFQDAPLVNGTKISIKVMVYGENGRSPLLPHLIHNADSAQFGITLDKLILNTTEKTSVDNDVAPLSGFSNPRWAMDFIMFSMEHRHLIGEGFQHKSVKSLDDEYSPGVFDVDSITTNLSRVNASGAYLQWRPVSYLTEDLDITYSTFPHVDTTFPELDYLDESTNKSLAFAVFGMDLITSLASTKSVVAFGQSKDDFYTGTNYTTWTLAYGIGSPPSESFSETVILIISLGSGIPLLVFILGGSYVGYRKIRGF